jgi:sec-independent protein translocase protein TatA
MFRNPLTDALVVLVVLLLFFGPKRLPMLSRSIGESIKEFKGGINRSSEKEDGDEKPQLAASSGEVQAHPESAQGGAEAPRQTTPVSAERDS